MIFKRASRLPVHYRNSFYLILTSSINAGFGFLFWIIAARLYPKEEIGFATALLSSVGLIIIFSKFGLDQSLIRYIPVSDKNSIINTSLIITTTFSFLFGLIFIIGIDFWSPKLNFLQSNYALLFLFFILVNSLSSLIETVFIGLRKGDFYFFQSIIVNSRIVFLLLFISLGALGIFLSIGVGYLLAILFALFLLKGVGIRVITKEKIGEIDKDFLYKNKSFSLSNYIIGLLNIAPTLILPLMVLNLLGAEYAAYYYIIYALASLLFIIPNAVSTSLFVEGSHGENLKSTAIKSTILTYALLIPIVAVFLIFGEDILSLIGKDYAEGASLLRIMSIVSLFLATFSIYSSIKKVQKKLKDLLFLNALLFVMIMITSYIFMLREGILGIGLAWLGSYMICSLMILISIKFHGEI